VSGVNDLVSTTSLSRTRYRKTERLLCCVFWTHLHTLEEQFLMLVGLVTSMWRYEVICNKFNATLVDLQLDAQNSYLFTWNTFIKILYMFRALPCSSSWGLRRNCIYAASGIVTLCRWLSCAPVNKELQFFLNRCIG